MSSSFRIPTTPSRCRRRRNSPLRTPALLRATRLRTSRARACNASSCRSFLFRIGFDLEHVLGPPLREHLLAFRIERLGRRSLEVLPDHLELASLVQVDEVARDHARVDDVANVPPLCVGAVGGVASGLGHADLLRADCEPRSEERRVGKEWRSRWAAQSEENNKEAETK